jgi:flagellar basal-body rod modification protein FlgD
LQIGSATHYQNTADRANSYSAITDASLGRDAFLQLMITQIRNQNPLDPLDDREFLSQMAQFSSLEQMQNLNNTVESRLRVINDTISASCMSLNAINSQLLMQQNLQAIGLLGSGIVAEVQEEGQQSVVIEGTVDRVSVKEGRVMLTVGDSTLYLDQVVNLKINAR